MREKITEVRDKLANKEEMDPEEIKSTVSDLQQSSLKLFEIAYKKVRASQHESNLKYLYLKSNKVYASLDTISDFLRRSNFDLVMTLSS